MTCPDCGNETYVLDTRNNINYTVRRRRECKSCGYRFSTHEKITKQKGCDTSHPSKVILYSAISVDYRKVRGTLIQYDGKSYIISEIVSQPTNRFSVACVKMIEVIKNTIRPIKVEGRAGEL